MKSILILPNGELTTEELRFKVAWIYDVIPMRRDGNLKKLNDLFTRLVEIEADPVFP